SDAVLRSSEGNIVWVKTKKGIFESRMVETGIVNRSNIVILSGLQEGDEIVLSGAYLLQSEYVFKKGMNPMAGHDM
ncbi:MAG: efflux transporter periplasmic adaptor subunit, partial [Cytophagales bacterium]|nr:efflux transporter periplasmic adaptor subunit [Cytophaga sp.]